MGFNWFLIDSWNLDYFNFFFSWTVPEKKKLEEDNNNNNIIVSSLNASQRFKLVSSDPTTTKTTSLFIYDFCKANITLSNCFFSSGLTSLL